MTFQVGGIKMDLPIMPGGGACKTPESIIPYMRNDVSVGAVETGSYTPLPRLGNEGLLFWPNDIGELSKSRFGLNSFGMPNLGFEQAFLNLSSQRLKHTKPVLVNIAGFSVDDYVSGYEIFSRDESLVAAIVGNGGCPNAHDGQTLPISYDLDTSRRIFDAIGKKNSKVPFWWKISPFLTKERLVSLKMEYPFIDFSYTPTVDEDFIHRFARLVDEYPFIKAVIGTNTLGNCIYRDNLGSPVTSPNDGKAGLSGPILKQISLEFALDITWLLPPNIDYIAAGGILNGDDAVDFFKVGAKAIQCTSGPFWLGDGPKFFEELISQSEIFQNYLIDQTY